MDRIFAALSHRIASWAGQPAAFILAALVVLLWLVTGPIFAYSDTWQLVINTGTTIVTFLMVFMLRNAVNHSLPTSSDKPPNGVGHKRKTCGHSAWV